MKEFVINQCQDVYRYLSAIDTKFPWVTQKPYPRDHVFDENQTVKWNRDKVDEMNIAINKSRMERMEAVNAYKCRLDDAIAEYMCTYLEGKLSVEKCREILDYASMEFEESLWEGDLDNILDMLDMALS